MQEVLQHGDAENALRAAGEFASDFSLGFPGFLTGLGHGAIKLCFLALPLSLLIALASFLSIWLVSRRREGLPTPRVLPYTARNICHSLLLVLLGIITTFLGVVLLVLSIFPSGHPDPAALMPPGFIVMLLIPLHFAGFARWGMHLSKKRTLAGLALFLLLTIAFSALALYLI